MNPLSRGSRPLRSTNFPPDRSKIAFRSRLDGDFDIYTVNPDGMGRTKVLDSDVRDASPDGLPDGENIVFQFEHPGNRNLFKMTNVGGNLTNVTTDLDLDGTTDWGPPE